LNSTWKIINKETGRISKHDDTQHLIEKFNGQNVAEQMNEYFISIANPSVTNYVSFMGQAIAANYPVICNKPSTSK
jgi:hypothetical protein